MAPAGTCPTDWNSAERPRELRFGLNSDNTCAICRWVGLNKRCRSIGMFRGLAVRLPSRVGGLFGMILGDAITRKTRCCECIWHCLSSRCTRSDVTSVSEITRARLHPKTSPYYESVDRTYSVLGNGFEKLKKHMRTTPGRVGLASHTMQVRPALARRSYSMEGSDLT